MDPTLITVRDLRTYFFFPGGRTVRAVDGVDFEIRRGEVLGLVGESGSGKSMTARSIIRLLDPRARIASGEILFGNRDLRLVSEREMRRIRGQRIAMVFQDPTTALNPVTSIGRQVANALTAHRRLERAAVRAESVRLLEQVRLPEPERVLNAYPHELSGGMRQRVVIAMALASDPDLLIADEPTTALDVTTQIEILALFDELRRSRQLAMLFITHNFGVVAYLCDEVCVMRHGRIVERGEVAAILQAPSHPYTRRLLDAIPDPERQEGAPSAAQSD